MQTRAVPIVATSRLPPFETYLPKLSSSLHKGSCGRILVVGGSESYSGAPFLAAMAALRAGTDLVTVLCPPDVSPIIKAYSPDLVVRGIFPNSEAECVAAVERAHAVLIGPGLGELNARHATTSAIARRALRLGKPLVVDADGLHLLPTLWSTQPDMTYRPSSRTSASPVAFRGRLVLTPNAMEIQRLAAALRLPPTPPSHASPEDPDASSWMPADRIIRELRARAIHAENRDVGTGDVVNPRSISLLTKGANEAVVALDCSSERTHIIHQDLPGSLRRVAGQGDVLAGFLSAFSAWHDMSDTSASSDPAPASIEDAAWQGTARHAEYLAAASTLMRRTQQVAFQKRQRSFVASDLLECIAVAENQPYAAGSDDIFDEVD